MKNSVLLCSSIFLCVTIKFVSLVAVSTDYAVQSQVDSLAHIPKEFFVERVLIDADAPIAHDEFLYLSGLKEKKIVHVSDIRRACFYLKQSSIWKSVGVSCYPEQQGFVVVFTLKAHWIIQSIAIKGIWFGKESIKQRYLQTVGSVFDQQKHDESLRLLGKFFKRIGYWQAAVDAHIIRNERTKKIHIELQVNRGPRFLIKNAQMCIIGDQSVLKHYKNMIDKQLRVLIGRPYKKYSVKYVVNFLRKLLVSSTVPCAPIQVTETIVKPARLLISFTIDASQLHTVIVRGNKTISTHKLFSYALHDLPSLSCVSVPFLINGIKRYYYEHSFLLATVSAHHTMQGWQIDIHEGERIGVQAVGFKGVLPEHMPALQNLCKWLLAKKENNQVIQAIEDAIVSYYQQHGFWDARIVEREFVRLPTDSYQLELSVDAGTQRFLKKHVIETDIPVLLPELYACVGTIAKPKPFDWYSIDDCKQRLEHCVSVHGLDARVSYEFVQKQDGIVLRWRIKCPVPPLCGKTLFMGNPGVSHKRLLTMLAYQEGSPLHVDALTQTFNHIHDTRVFESVRVSPLTENDPDGKTPLIITLDASNPFEAQLRFGLVGTNNLELSTYTFGFSLLGKNITSQLDTLAINVELTRFCRDCALWYRYPRVGGLPCTVHVRLFDKKTDVLCAQASEHVWYTALQRGLAAQADYYNSIVKAAISMGGEGINITHLCASCAQALLFEPAMRNYYEPYCVLEPALDLMHVDDSLNPRVGFTTHVGARVMMACKTPHASFARLWGEQAFFVPLSARLVGALRLRAGYIACQSFSCLMPSERFYLGGSCSIRSYQQDYMPPLAKCVVTNRCVWMPLGSRIMLSINAEARVTVSANVGLVFFQDVGALWHEKQRCFYTGGATGFGFRYLTPIGPLRFDIGIKNKQSPDDCLPLAWFLTIGHAF